MLDDYRIPNDVWTLGRLDIWNQCFLNIVNETDFSYRSDFPFLSEKIWKPILGLRPFVINGNPSVYQLLKDQGFYTFEEYWPSNTDFFTNTEYNYYQFKHHIAGVVELLSSLTQKQLWSMYKDMLPKLEHNRQHFSFYCRQQWHKVRHQFKKTSTKVW